MNLKSSDFNQGVPSLKFLGSSDGNSNMKFIFNRDVQVNEYIKVYKYEDNIYLLTDNFDVVDINPKKIAINKNFTFYSKPLYELLNNLFIFAVDSVFELEPVYYGENDTNVFIGYFIVNLVTNNQQQTNI